MISMKWPPRAQYYLVSTNTFYLEGYSGTAYRLLDNYYWIPTNMENEKLGQGEGWITK